MPRVEAVQPLRVSAPGAWALEPRKSSSRPLAISTNRALLMTSSPARFIRWSSRSTLDPDRLGHLGLARPPRLRRGAVRPIAGSGSGRRRYGSGSRAADRDRASAGSGDRRGRRGDSGRGQAGGARRRARRGRPSGSATCEARLDPDPGHAVDVGQRPELFGVALRGQPDGELGERLDLVELSAGGSRRDHPSPRPPAGSGPAWPSCRASGRFGLEHARSRRPAPGPPGVRSGRTPGRVPAARPRARLGRRGVGGPGGSGGGVATGRCRRRERARRGFQASMTRGVSAARSTALCPRRGARGGSRGGSSRQRKVRSSDRPVEGPLLAPELVEEGSRGCGSAA